MPRPPNYNQERKDRDRIKAAKKAEKLAAKQARRQGDAGGDAGAGDVGDDRHGTRPGDADPRD